MDLEDYPSAQVRLRKAIEGTAGARWGVVLAAAILGQPQTSGAGANGGDFERVFKTNVVGNLAILDAVLPQMIAARHGRVVLFAGGGAAYAYPVFPAYALSKVATVRLTENLAATYAPCSGLSFVCLAPGAVDTPTLARVQEAGGEVKTKTNIEEPVRFIETYLQSDSTALSGRYVHVRDNWAPYLDGTAAPARDQFLLRRIE